MNYQGQEIERILLLTWTTGGDRGRITYMDLKWVDRSACRGIDPIIFYPVTDEEAGPAKSVCSECPVQADCLEHAISHREHNGVWGGATERERQRIIRRRRRARTMGLPLEDEIASLSSGVVAG